MVTTWPRARRRIAGLQLAAVVGMSLTALPALAIDYLSVAEPAVLYDGPSNKAKQRYVVARDTPLEMVLTVGNWTKVRDQEGEMTWIEKSALAPKRTVIVRVDRSQIRAAAVDTAPLVFEAERQVVLDLVEKGPAGWAKVKHRDGQTGFVKAAQVWGL